MHWLVWIITILLHDTTDVRFRSSVESTSGTFLSMSMTKKHANIIFGASHRRRFNTLPISTGKSFRSFYFGLQCFTSTRAHKLSSNDSPSLRCPRFVSRMRFSAHRAAAPFRINGGSFSLEPTTVLRREFKSVISVAVAFWFSNFPRLRDV